MDDSFLPCIYHQPIYLPTYIHTYLGHPLIMPIINSRYSVRGFHIIRNGYLSLQHVRVRRGGGTRRPAWYKRAIFPEAEVGK